MKGSKLIAITILQFSLVPAYFSCGQVDYMLFLKQKGLRKNKILNKISYFSYQVPKNQQNFIEKSSSNGQNDPYHKEKLFPLSYLGPQGEHRAQPSLPLAGWLCLYPCCHTRQSRQQWLTLGRLCPCLEQLINYNLQRLLKVGNIMDRQNSSNWLSGLKITSLDTKGPLSLPHRL